MTDPNSHPLHNAPTTSINAPDPLHDTHPQNPDAGLSNPEAASQPEATTTTLDPGGVSGDGRGPPERPPSFWRLFQDNRTYVMTYCGVFGSFGVCVGFLGPTVFDLGCQTHSDQKEMNWVFFVQLLMTLVGSITAGCLAESTDPEHPC